MLSSLKRTCFLEVDILRVANAERRRRRKALRMRALRRKKKVDVCDVRMDDDGCGGRFGTEDLQSR
jgi:hypothetical protein